MDEINITNYAELCGTLAAAPVFSHSGRGESFYSFPLEIERLSGAYDTVNVIARGSLLESIELKEAEKICVMGELRSFNNKSGEGARLVITIFAKEILLCGGEDTNIIRLIGTLCKKPNLRTTPMGRDICDLMLAVNRKYGRSDYLPCIAWGQKAREATEWDVGTTVSLEGRIQSRTYIKLIDDVPVEKTAFEVSVIEIGVYEK